MGKKSTKTSNFGVSKRESHDASQFYASRLYDGLKINEKQSIIDNSNKLSIENFNHKFQFNPKNIQKVHPNSIHLIIFQIPKLHCKEIHSQLSKIEKAIIQISNFLVTGGRLIIVVDNQIIADNGHTKFYPLQTKLTRILINEGLILRGNIILSSTPKKIEYHEDMVNSVYNIALLSSKDVLKRVKKNKTPQFEKSDTITRDLFLSATKSVWKQDRDFILEISNNSDLSIYFADYIRRFLHLFSFEEDIILYLLPEITDNLVTFANNHRTKNFFFEWI